MLAVSVIIPTFNGAQFIGRTLDSILQQDYPPAEIIVVNDGSTHDTASVVRTYAPGVQADRYREWRSDRRAIDCCTSGEVGMVGLLRFRRPLAS